MKRSIAFWLGILVVVIALGGIGYFFFLSGPVLGPALTADGFARLDEVRRVANRDLENQAQLDVGAGGTLSPQQVASEQIKKLGEMAAPYASLAKELPDEVIGPRNEAVAWMLAQMPNGIDRQGLSDEDAKKLDEQTSAAIVSLVQKQGQESSSYMLTALFAMRRIERFRRNAEAVKKLNDEAQLALEKALQVDPKNFAAAYQLGVLLDSSRRGELSPEAFEAFGRAFGIRPGNFYVLMRRLDSLVRTKHATTGEACRAAKAQCECVRRRILRENDPESDLIVLLDRAADAADADKWDEAEESLQIFSSWLSAIASDLGDLPEVTPHPLDYMVFEFSPALREQFPQKPSEATLIDVSFPVSPPLPLTEGEETVAARLLDFDLDGKLELALIEQQGGIGSRLRQRLKIYRREEDGKWTHFYTLDNLDDAMGMCWGDLDRDEDPQIQGDDKADLDLLVYGTDALQVFRNEKVAGSNERSLIPIATLSKNHFAGATLVDVDHDGDLDVVAFKVNVDAPYVLLFLNRGDGQFEDATAYSSFVGAFPHAHGFTPVDFDRDGDLDVMMTCRRQVGYLDNLRHGQMRWRTLSSDFDDLLNSVKLIVAELDGNASWDLVIEKENQIIVILTEQTGEGEVRVKSRKVVAKSAGQLRNVADFDNDGQLDLLLFAKPQFTVMRGDGAGGFLETEKIDFSVPEHALARTTTDVDDIDGDGDLDLIYATDQITTAINEGGNKNTWLAIRPRGAEDNVSGKVNHFGIGTLVEVRTGPRYQAAVTDRPTVHFGLGNAKSADQIRMIFTNGFPQSVLQSRLAGNQVIVEDMALKGSCPYVYTDRGNGWEFFSDCLWGAPIGMQYAEGKLQPGRAWEYLKLPGELLKEKDGAYKIKFTEELWEATYVDHVSLIAVDHPENVEIFTNEKVGPPSVAENRLFTVSERKTPLAAKDLKGRDVSKTLAKADGDFTQGWDKSYKQGLVERHGLELDLGAFEPNASVVLYLTGWIMPTDTSLNVAITQDPNLEGPRPPSLSVFNEQGQPQEVIPMVGFPGGKTKTIAIDLTGKFLSNDHRVVIATTHQIYWDEAFFTINEPVVEIETRVLPLTSAQMVYHGFSQKRPPLPCSPSMFDASKIDRATRWMPMGGGFTPFGDALPLLTAADDQMAIIGSGDGLELAFQSAAPTKSGWKRDFILHSVGWDKDADLNTFFGQTVGPMPVGADGGYLGPAVIGPVAPEGTRIVPRSRFWKQLTHSAQ